jgi:hypothetical protein
MTAVPIPVGSPTYRATWSGTLANSEIFSFHQSFYSPTVGAGDAGAASVTLGTHITTLLATAVTGLGTMAAVFASTTAWNRLTVEVWNTATNARIGDPVYTALTSVGTGAAALPNQIAQCITLHASPFGARNRNRFYLPTYSAQVAGTFVAPAGIVNANVCTALTSWLHARNIANLAAAYPLGMAVYSPSAHASSEVQDCVAGNVVDTIRRRRNKVAEVRTAVSV